MATTKKGAKKPPKTMKELTENFEEFMKGKEANPNTKKDFEKVLKKAVNKKHKKAKH